MQSEQVLSLRDQIDQLEEESSEQLNYFCVLSGTSKSNGLENFYKLGGSGAKPLWLNTPYADWEEVMPYLVNIESDSPFLDWLEEEQPVFPDWGLLVASSFGFDEVFSHFESLTKVFMPSGKEVFFRYWDAPQVMPIYQLSGAESVADLLGPISELISANGTISNPQTPHLVGESYPWWQLSQQVQSKLFEANSATLEANLLQQLSNRNPILFEAYPSEILKRKVQRLIRLDQLQASITSYAGIETYLQKELKNV
ncbi:DUF4123 domain-containing protein [Neptuniibacter sp. QD72_48]|uniref:DUF4123 domain-containing protein n=1 Tax=unclassified Neptuniibacter TaxID=2630693 RepID=UPI0039F64610